MTLGSRNLVAIAAAAAVLAFLAAFLISRAGSGGTQAPLLPAPLSLPATQVKVQSVSLTSQPPALRRKPARHVVVAPQSPSTSEAPAPSVTAPPAVSSPAPSPSKGTVTVG